MSVFFPLPPELLLQIFDNLTASHTCRTCAQRDLHSLTLVSRFVNAVATPYLYSTLCLRTHAESTSKTSESAPKTTEDTAIAVGSPDYEARLRLLSRTLSASPGLGALVKRVRFAHEEPATEALWASLVSLLPSLRILQGIDVFFSSDMDGLEAETPSLLASNAHALATLQRTSNLREAVLQYEYLPCALSTLLLSWPHLETLVLGAVCPATYAHESADTSFADLRKALTGGCRQLKNVYFHDCDLDSSSPSDRDDTLAAMPPLERLGVEYSTGFSLRGISGFLKASKLNAATLHTLDFHRQLRAPGCNTLNDIAEVLVAATNLKRLSLALIRYADASHDDVNPPDVLASATLEELRWVPVFVHLRALPAGTVVHDEFDPVLETSLRMRSMPKLKTLTVGHECKAKEKMVLGIYSRLEEMTAEKVLERAGVKLVLEKHEEKGELRLNGKTKEKVSGLKRGVGRREVCEVAVEAAGEGVGKEQVWDVEDEGDLLGLWMGSRV